MKQKSNAILVMLEFTPQQIENLMGGASHLEKFTGEQLTNMLLSSLTTDKKVGRSSLFSALLSMGLVMRNHMLELILQVDKTKLSGDAAMLLESLKAKYRIDKDEKD